MQFVSNGFNIVKLNGSIHVHMLIIEEMWKNLLIHFNINAGFKSVTSVLINYGKCNGFNVFKVDGSTHVACG
jgi:hypothetical protein